jgi:hypothetical protein
MDITDNKNILTTTKQNIMKGPARSRKKDQQLTKIKF